ncbi:uncharacterized protein BDR25DRAFT_369852 [Lindgomyces ingoldianus]|uniref:Uncharacterized protein n=1 Tax=Lindgomyces ingoldianus TaxID=673940 RepID=A0ACB6QSU3_9PLEO|nr:uncharacterized protein BDR25DRAFT_369852 [Lindgomyces ingoldianus]KAF2469961.1 hypothetical protein BDR25DRAFT_369852 [Lindgomyces ingoldianus]
MALVILLPCCMIYGIAKIMLSTIIVGQAQYFAEVVIPLVRSTVVNLTVLMYSAITAFSALISEHEPPGPQQPAFNCLKPPKILYNYCKRCTNGWTHWYFARDLKLAHYMKIPPKVTFACQIVAAILACFVQIAVMNRTLGVARVSRDTIPMYCTIHSLGLAPFSYTHARLGNIPEVCDRLQKGHFTFPNGRAFFSNSITWGVIGPQSMFGLGSTYSSIHFYWFIRAILPVTFYTLNRYAPRSPARYLHAPVTLGAMAWLLPATPLSFSSRATIGFIFNVWIMRRWHGWWHNYNYLTTAGLDSGLTMSTIVVFFAISLPNVTLPEWWRNVVPFEIMDYLNTAIQKTAAKGQTFGPRAW